MDIQNKEFERSFRGYDIEDVDEFLDRVAKDLEQLTRENMELKDQLGQMQEKNKNYQKLEGTMHNAIVVAQETAEEVKQSAKREADLIKREAEREGQRIVEEARNRANKIYSEQEDLFKKAYMFKMRFRSFIEAQLSNLENEDWLSELQEDQGSGESKQDFAAQPEFETRTGFDDKTDLQPDFEPDFKPETEFDATANFDIKRDYDPEPDYKPQSKDKPEPEQRFRSEPEPKYQPESEFEPKFGFSPQPDFDADRGPVRHDRERIERDLDQKNQGRDFRRRRNRDYSEEQNHDRDQDSDSDY